MSWHSIVVENRYEDSVRLLGLARELRSRDGVSAAEVLVGSEGNCRLLSDRLGVSVTAHPTGIVVALDADDEETAEAALAAAREYFERSAAGPTREHEATLARSLATAAAALDANVALVSVPGEYAALEAAKALEAGLHVFLFSDHVSVPDEVALKRAAIERGLLLMGPGCGTSMLGGVGLGFANEVRGGPVGIVAAAGTGAQEAACLLDVAGVGVSQIIGVGGRDLSTDVAGAMTLAGARLLAEDPETETILLISKPPSPSAVAALADGLPAGKRVVAGFVGWKGGELPFPVASTLDEAVRLAGAELDTRQGEVLAKARACRRPGVLRGLYSGGTLCSEALVVLRPLLGPVASNVGGDAEAPHLVLDLGEEEFTAGRPHPMVDLGLRIERLLAEANDPAVTCLLLDVVLGHGSHPDPASELAPAIEEARARNEGLAVVAHVCGTNADPQDAQRQEQVLVEAGAITAPTNALAARAAAAVVATG